MPIEMAQRRHVDSQLARRVKHGRARRHFNFAVVDGEFRHDLRPSGADAGIGQRCAKPRKAVLGNLRLREVQVFE